MEITADVIIQLFQVLNVRHQLLENVFFVFVELLKTTQQSN